MGQPLYCSAADAGIWRKRLWWWLHPLHMTQQYRLASMAAWLSSAGISHHSLLPHIPSLHLSAVNRSPHPRFAPQSLKLTRWHVSLLGLCMAAVRTVWFSFHLGFHRSPVSLSALNGSPMTIALMWGSDHCFSSPTCRAGLVLLALLFLLLIPSSYRVLCGSKYSFPLVRFSCLLSAGVLHTLLCLKVYFWCIHGERCSPRPPIPLPSWSPNSLVFIFKFSVFLFWF